MKLVEIKDVRPGQIRKVTAFNQWKDEEEFEVLAVIEMHRKFADSLQNRFYNSTTISEFEEWDLWTLNESGDCSGSEQEALFWRKVREEEQD